MHASSIVTSSPSAGAGSGSLIDLGPAATAPALDQAPALREAMRHLAGGVSVITAGIGPDRTGLTVTSATSLSLEPATMLICVNRAASAWPVIRKHEHFAVNILSANQQHVAERFAGRGGVKGLARYEGATWRELASGASGLDDALAVIDCAVDEIIERRSHGIILGAVLSVTLGVGTARMPLIYAHGRFTGVDLPSSGIVQEPAPAASTDPNRPDRSFENSLPSSNNAALGGRAVRWPNHVSSKP